MSGQMSKRTKCLARNPMRKQWVPSSVPSADTKSTANETGELGRRLVPMRSTLK